MNDIRRKEILSFFAQGNSYKGLKLQDMNFTKKELFELNAAEYIMCTDPKLQIYLVTIKGFRCLRGIVN